jgi:hypothetical protein
LPPIFWYHIALTTLFATAFTGFDSWWMAPAIFVFHGAIDVWKSYQKDNLTHFIADQALHGLSILLLWGIRFPHLWQIKWHLPAGFSETQVLTVALSALFLSVPAGICIGKLTQRFRDQIPTLKDESLENAGTWIGILERLLIYFLVLIQEFEAIGLLVAAKSILRLKEGERKMSEYVLIGTLLSISLALSLGYFVAQVIR